jgi:serine/threonine protein kinase
LFIEPDEEPRRKAIVTERVGQQFGNYRLIRLVGEGGFAEVYLSEHIHLGTQVAIKVLYTQLISDDVDKFRTEARTVARLIHPHIVRVLDFGVEGKTPFLVMDYAPNGTLRQRHSKGTCLPLDTIVSYVQQVADALQYAHDEKLIHRDIKPENMLLGRNNEILLSDFGIALVSQSSRYQNTQDVVGTISYMSPEQIQGKPRPASDQYALGIVVYEWLSGDRPFHGSFTELCTQHMFALPQPLSEKVPMIPHDVEQVVLTALEKDPHRRFENVQAFAAALEKACQTTQSHLGAFPREITPPTKPSLPSESVSTVLPTRLPRSTIADTPSQASKVPLPSKRELARSGRSQSSKNRLSQRIVLWVLTALVILGGGFTWLTLSHPPSGSAVNPTLIATSTTAFILTATSQPTSPPTATPSPTPTPSPTSPVIVAQPTLTTDCAHLVVPWVALYQYSNFGGRELCFEGTGLINLTDFGFDKQTMAINIAANGVFFDQSNGQGGQLGFYYGDEKADLGNWDNRISSFRVDS